MLPLTEGLPLHMLSDLPVNDLLPDLVCQKGSCTAVDSSLHAGHELRQLSPREASCPAGRILQHLWTDGLYLYLVWS